MEELVREFGYAFECFAFHIFEERRKWSFKAVIGLCSFK